MRHAQVEALLVWSANRKQNKDARDRGIETAKHRRIALSEAAVHHHDLQVLHLKCI
jgi:hypothetical protein